MNRNSNVRFVKPKLEELEDRVQPSFLLQGTVQAQLLPPLQSVFTDMQSAKNDLQTQFNLLHTTGALTTDAQAEASFARGAADFQRMLNDQHAITLTVNADTAFIRAAAFAEFAEGDPIDAIIVVFGPAIGFNPTSALTNVQTQANTLINGNDVQTWINTDFFPTTPSGFETHATWAQVTQTPLF
jgi:hypothetical protein